MYIIAITNWKRKIIYFVALLLIIALVAFIVPQMLGINTTATDSEPQEEEMLTQPIKVQGPADETDSLNLKPNN
ncbi:MAG: hypothetical protein GXW85_13530 [Clostridia bacterium]|nr:hypothetical protein [Clostridia bacterium]